MSKINRAPLGLAGVFDARTGGDNADVLSEVIAPTIDVLPFYGARIGFRVANNTGSFAGPAPENGPTVTVPDDETWLVFAVQCRYTTAGTGDGLATTIIQRALRPADGVVVDFALSFQDNFFGGSGVIASERMHVFTYPNRFVAGPGTVWRYDSVDSLAGTAYPIANSINVIYTQLTPST